MALIGCDVDGDGNLTMSNSIIEDTGWHGGAGLVFAQESTGNRVSSMKIKQEKKTTTQQHLTIESLYGNLAAQPLWRRTITKNDFFKAAKPLLGCSPIPTHAIAWTPTVIAMLSGT